MENLEFKQIIEIDEDNLNRITNWMYNWWGNKDGYTFEKVKYYMKNSMQKDRFPKTYGLFLDNKIIGMYQFTLEDLDVRPDIYPWLANVYIDEEYRNKGYAVRLVSHCIAKILAQGKNAILTTAETNHSMICAAKKAGFMIQE